jgi:adenylate kinase
LICSDCKAVYAADYSEINCSECQGSLTKRSDDNEEAILKRIANFKTETIPVIEEYAEADQLIKINGEQSIEKVAAEIENILTDLRKKG